MVFNISNDIVGDCEVYRLTFDGSRQISKCFKKSTTLHVACENLTYYETAPHTFENLLLKISDFNTNESIEDMDIEVQSGEPESGKEFVELNDNLGHEDMDIGLHDNPEIEIPESTADKSTEDMVHETEIPENTSNQKEIVQPDDVFPIDSIPDIEAILKARIVTNHNGKLKIQCLHCMKTPPNIVTHAEEGKCKLVFSDQLKDLFDRLHYYQRRNWNQKYQKKNKEHLNQKSRESYEANPGKKKQASKDSYAKNPDPKREKSRDYSRKALAENPDFRTFKNWRDKEFSKKSYEADPEKKKESSRAAYNANPEPKKQKKRESYWNKDEESIRQNFMKKQAEGLSYICICCHRLLFKTNVAQYKVNDTDDEVVVAIRENELEHCISTDDSKKHNDSFWLCVNCKTNLKDGKMPNMCHANGLRISEIPEELKDLSFIELMMIKKKLIFIKIRELHASRMMQMS